MLDMTIFLSAVILIIIWVWPYDDPTDPYDDPDNWGSR